jgi:membrane protein YqaA with SNARE-associated domain
MRRFVTWVQGFAAGLGGPGIFLVALLDSSPFMTLPEIADLLLVTMVVRNHGELIWYVICATAGSIGGCLMTYYVGKKGGDALIRKRFHPASVEKTLAAFQRHGIMAVLIPSILPPPAPFKIFVLLAGVAGISTKQFVQAIAIGRGARYTAEGLLALWYGRAALAFIHEHALTASLAVVGLLAAGFVAYLFWTRKPKKTR